MLNLNIQYDTSVTDLQGTNPTLYSQFTSGVATAVQAIKSFVGNSITVTIDVGYGEINGQPLSAGALGQSEFNVVPKSYASVRNALIGQNAPGSSTLPTTSPDHGTLYLTTAEAKALELAASNGSLDGYVGVSSTAQFSYGNGTTPPPNAYYFIGVVEHEITEVMGRFSLLDGQPNYYATMDLFRYTASGTRALSTGGNGSTAFFSIDDGATRLGSWNNNPNNGDLGDWYPSGPAPGGHDAFNDFSTPGVVNVISQADMTSMHALGWTSAAPVTVSSVTAQPATGDLGAGGQVAIALGMSGAVTVSGGTPSLTLNDGGSATYSAGASTSTSLVFQYVAAAGQNTAALAVTAFNLNGATVTDGGGNAADMSGAAATFNGLQIDTTAPSFVANTNLLVAANATVTITSGTLRFDDNLSSHAQETYTITSAPQDGMLLLNGAPAGSFTQADVDNGLVSYHETAAGVASDSFAFTIADPAGNATSQQAHIHIQSMLVGNDDSNVLTGTSGADVIYGFDPNGPQSQVNSITATRVASGLQQPVFAVAPPGDQARLFIVEKTGTIKILDLNTGQVLGAPFLDISGQVATSGIESGLLGLAFDPNYSQNGYFYVNFITPGGVTQISRYQVSGADSNQANAGSAQPVLTISQAAGVFNHKGGWLAFGTDGLLYASIGDGALGNAAAQDINSLLGKILRLDVHGDAFPGDPSRNYALPADNMFVGVAGADEVWALGLRNPWRPSFDRATGDLYIADVGENKWEEVNIGQAGANYGWNVYEGPDVFAGGTPSAGSLTSPAYYYGHNVGQAITGGYVYRGTSDGLQGQYFFADYVKGKIFTLNYNNGTWTSTDRTAQVHPDTGAITNPSSFSEDGRGDLYLIDLNGNMFRLTPDVNSVDQADQLFGGGGGDYLFGGAGNDLLDGGTGADQMTGGVGDDTYWVDDLNDRVDEDPSQGTDTVFVTVSGYTVPVNVEIGRIGVSTGLALTGNGATDAVYGNIGNDTLLGGAGIDNMVGEAGDDTLMSGTVRSEMTGGTGDDTYWVNHLNDHVYENANEGTDTVFVTVSGYSVPVNVEIARIAVSTGLTLTGNGAIDAMYGNVGNDVLLGGTGIDNMVGGAGDDTLMSGTVRSEMTGGTGNDSYWVNNGNDHAYENAGEGTDIEFASLSRVLDANVENLTLTGPANLTGAGNGLDNVITGNSGNNSLDGGVGNDTLNGGVGNDTLIGGAGNDALFGDDIGGPVGSDSMIGGMGDDAYFVNGPGDTAVESQNEGTDVVHSFIDFTLPANVEILALISPATVGIGNNLDNRILGNDLDNVLDGGSGADFMRGHGGNDTFMVDNLGDQIEELANEGTDTVFVTVSGYTVPVNVEIGRIGVGSGLALTGNGAIDGMYGNIGNDTLLGGTGIDNMVGDAGDDTLISGTVRSEMTGGPGDDTYWINHLNDHVYENANEGVDTIDVTVSGYAVPTNVEIARIAVSTGLTLTGNGAIDAVYGNVGNDVLLGGAGIDNMVGGSGDDTLISGTVRSEMTGGPGDDTYWINHLNDHVYENANEGVDTIDVTVSGYTVPTNVEIARIAVSTGLTLTGNGAIDAMYGNVGNDVLIGGTGIDNMVGGAGDDVLISGSVRTEMTGGTGNDSYWVNNGNDHAYENAGEGTDIEFASLSRTLDANVENLTLTGSANLTGTGNSLANIITGNSGDNFIDGRSGADTVTGAGGNDTFIFRPSEANGDAVTDFSSGADKFQFVNYGTAGQGATFTQVDATHWSINSFDNQTHDVILLSNGAAINPGDYSFV